MGCSTVFKIGRLNLIALCFLASGLRAQAGLTEYQAEDAALNITFTSTEHAGYSGSGYVQNYEPGNIGAATTFSVSVAADGYYDVILTYANGYDATSLSVYVDERKQLVTALSSTGAWASWSSRTETFRLSRGSHTIAYKLDSGDGGRVNLDKIGVRPTTESKPDLEVGRLLWSPVAPAEGGAVRFMAVIRNDGTGPSPAVAHRVSFRVDNQEVVVSSRHSRTIAAGGSDTLTADTTWTASHGTYGVTAVVDPGDAIDELVESNNAASASLTLTQLPGPDLKVKSIAWSPANPKAGDKMRFTVTLQNQGLDPAEDGAEVSLKINGTTTLSGALGAALAAGASVPVTLDGQWTAQNGSMTVVATADPRNLVKEAVESNNSRSSRFYIGRGAQVPWIAYEAEDGQLSGGAKIIGPSRTYGTPAGEASGRRAVILEGANQAVEWTATAAANSIVIRNCIPDAPGGGGIETPIGLYVNGQHKADITLSSKHSWIYGRDNDPQTDDPANGQARKVYDEAQLLFKGFGIEAGDKVMLRRDAKCTAAYVVIDFIDLEQVGAPIPMPAGYISITDPNQTWAPAIPDDAIEDDNALFMCMMQAQAGKYAGVYIPEGTFIQRQKQQASGVKIQGAGMWRSKLYCPDQNEGDWGTTGFIITGDNCEFRDFALFGWGGRRLQGGKAFCNSARRDMVVERVWFEHVVCAYWVGGGQESTNLLVKDCRIRNTGADGINLCNGSQGCVIDNCHARNTGDDAFAIWSATDGFGQPCIDNVVRNCTAVLPWRAACFAIYGGRGNRIENCIGADAITYPGLTVSSEFQPHPMQSATVDGLTLYRCGGRYFHGYDYEGEFGAIWLRADMDPTNGISIRNVDVIDPTFQGIKFQGSGTFTHTLLENITIANPGTIGTEVTAEVAGEATLRGVQVVSNQYGVPELLNRSSGFKLVAEQVAVQPRQKDGVGLSAAISSAGSRLLIEFVVPQAEARRLSDVAVSVYQVNGRQVLQQRHRLTGGRQCLRLERGGAWQAAGLYVLAVDYAGKRQTYPILLR